MTVVQLQSELDKTKAELTRKQTELDRHRIAYNRVKMLCGKTLKECREKVLKKENTKGYEMANKLAQDVLRLIP